MVYSNCQCSSAFCSSMTFLLILVRIALWPSAGKELSSWLSVCAVSLYAGLNCVCISFPLGVRAGCGILFYYIAVNIKNVR